MPPLTDPAILAKLRHALESWNFTGYITWKEVARLWVENNLEGFTTRSIAEKMCEHVAAGGRVDQVKETREEWSADRFHYDFRISVGRRIVYIETILVYNPIEPTLHVVSIHDA